MNFPLNLDAYVTSQEHCDCLVFFSLKRVLADFRVFEIDETSVAHISFQSLNADKSFPLLLGQSFLPDEVHVMIMELCPLWAHGRPLVRSLYRPLWM